MLPLKTQIACKSELTNQAGPKWSRRQELLALFQLIGSVQSSTYHATQGVQATAQSYFKSLGPARPDIVGAQIYKRNDPVGPGHAIREGTDVIKQLAQCQRADSVIYGD